MRIQSNLRKSPENGLIVAAIGANALATLPYGFYIIAISFIAGYIHVWETGLGLWCIIASLASILYFVFYGSFIKFAMILLIAGLQISILGMLLVWFVSRPEAVGLVYFIVSRFPLFVAPVVTLWAIGDVWGREIKIKNNKTILPCKKCGYETVGLERCPECGQEAEIKRSTRRMQN